MADEETTTPVKKTGKAAAAEVAALKSEGKPITLRDQDFAVVKELPGITILDLGLAADPEANDFARLKAIREVLDVAIIPAEMGRFKNLLKYADPVIGIEELDGVISQLIEQVMGRPT